MEPILSNHRAVRSNRSKDWSRPWTCWRHLSRLRLPSAAGKRSQHPDQGSMLVEVLVAVCIVTAALGILASQLTTQASSPRKAAALSAIETAANTDLNWIRGYSKIYLAESGPFNIPESTSTNSITKASSFTQSSNLSYQADQPDTIKDPTGSLNLNLCTSDSFTSSFLSAADSVQKSSDLLPNSIADIADSPPVSGATKQIPLSKEAGTSTLWRTITFTGQNDLITISYSMGTDPFNLGFKLHSAVLIEAAAWCSQ